MIKAVVFDYGLVIRSRRLRLQKPLLELAAQLRKDGIKTAVLSNGLKPLTWLVKIRRDLKDFEPVVFCADIGVRKPDPKSYEFIVKKLGLKPEECLFVDNLPENIAGAAAVGMQTVLDKNTAQTVENIKRQIKANL